jgi:hypothetical protein
MSFEMRFADSMTVVADLLRKDFGMPAAVR